jgi:hypothetical protein
MNAPRDERRAATVAAWGRSPFTRVTDLPHATNVKSDLLDQLRRAIRLKNYSIRTERAYANWVYRFILFHQLRHPREMGATEINAFLSYLATDLDVAASTQNQACSGIVFLYKHVLKKELTDFGRVKGSAAWRAALACGLTPRASLRGM